MKVFSRDIEIPEGESVSSVVDLGSVYNVGTYQMLGFQMPEDWTASSLAFSVSHDGQRFSKLHWSGDALVLEAEGGSGPGLAVSVEPAAFAGWPYVRLECVDGEGDPVNQADTRTIHVMLGSI